MIEIRDDGRGIVWPAVAGLVSAGAVGVAPEAGGICDVHGGSAARATGIGDREALGIGTLMNARGLMELIIINIGLQRGIAEITSARLRDAHVRFFTERNPGHVHGDEDAGEQRSRQPLGPHRAVDPERDRHLRLRR